MNRISTDRPPPSEGLRVSTLVVEHKVRRNERFSPAWERAGEVIALYRDGSGHKMIAKTLGISPRIAREILIARAEWRPRTMTSGRKGQGEWSRVQRPQHLADAMANAIRRQGQRLNDLHAAMERVVRREAKASHPTHGMTEAQSCKWKYGNVPEFRLRHLLRQRMRKLIIRGQKSGSTLDLVGCTTAQVREHIEKQFKKGMGWHNNGTGKGRWHIDHIIPCSSFDLTRPDQQRIAFHWSNLRPMWSIANIRKGDTITHLNNQLRFPL